MSKANWNIANISDLTGKVIIVTGGNSGLGYESIKAFAEKGAEVILASRSLEKGEAAKKNLGQTKGKVVVMQLDLTDLKSVQSFAEKFKSSYDQLDILLNNAGIMTTPYFTTKDGIEGQIGVNHFGHFALTGHLLPTLKNTPKARVVNVSSAAHRYGDMDFENLLFEGGKGYTALKSYGRYLRN